MSARVVVDTNVFVSALLGGGAAHQVVRACLEGRCTPLMGSALLSEYEEFMTRSALFQRSPLGAGERETLLNIFLAQCEWTRVYFGWRPNLPDEADNHLVELAVAGAASFIVTRNLRDVDHGELRFPGLQIVDPPAFLKELSPWPP